MKLKSNRELNRLFWDDNPSIERIKELLAACPDINAIDENGRQILWYAVCTPAQPQIVELILEKGAEVNGIDKNGRSVFTAIALMEPFQRDKAELLIQHGADVNFVSEDGMSVLMCAMSTHNVYCNPKEAVEFLIQYGADVNFINQDGLSVLVHALRNVPVELVKLLIEHGAKLDCQDTLLLKGIGHWFEPEIVAFLLKKGVNPNVLIKCSDSSVLDRAFAFWEFDIQGKTKTNGKSPWVNKDLDRHATIVDLLLEAGAKRAEELRATKVGTWVEVSGDAETTGVYTNTGVLPIERIPNITPDLQTHFKDWHCTYQDLWKPAKEDSKWPLFRDVYLEANNQEGLEVAGAIKELVGETVVVTYSYRRADPSAECGYEQVQQII